MLWPCLSSLRSRHSPHQLWGRGAGDGVPPPVPAPHGDLHLGNWQQPWQQLVVEREQAGRELNNKLALSGGFHLFCFKFLAVSACRARQRPRPAARGEGACMALPGCRSFGTKTGSPRANATSEALLPPSSPDLSRGGRGHQGIARVGGHHPPVRHQLPSAARSEGSPAAAPSFITLVPSGRRTRCRGGRQCQARTQRTPPALSTPKSSPSVPMVAGRGWGVTAAGRPWRCRCPGAHQGTLCPRSAFLGTSPASAGSALIHSPLAPLGSH